MSPEVLAFLKLAEETLQFDYESGNVTPIKSPHGTGWRRCPSLITAQCVNGRIHIQAEGHPNVTTRLNQMFAMPPNLLHNAELVSDGQAFSRWSHVNYSIMGSIDVSALLDIPLVIKDTAAEKLGDINEELGALRAIATPTLQHVFKKKALGFQLLSEIAQLSTLKPDSLTRLSSTHRIAPALAYIHAHLHDDLTRDTVADVVHLSGSRFQTVFREALGMPPRDYIQRQRMLKAQQLLLGSGLPVKEVAAQVGHDDPFHFSRAFKKEIGVSPMAYRRQGSARSM